MLFEVAACMTPHVQKVARMEQIVSELELHALQGPPPDLQQRMSCVCVLKVQLSLSSNLQQPLLLLLTELVCQPWSGFRRRGRQHLYEVF